MDRILIGHDNENDPDGNKHDWLCYKYKDYIFNKEWYMNMENEYVLGLTLYKKGAKNKLCSPFKYKNKYYNEIFHSGNCKDDNDDETIEFVEKVVNKKC